MTATGSHTVDRDAVVAAVAEVPDPEMPAVTLAMLGVVHDVTVADGHVTVELLPTFAGCPATDMMAEDVERAVGAVRGVTSVAVRFPHAPRWTPDRITAAGRDALRAFGIAPPGEGAGRRGQLPVVSTPSDPPAEPPRPCPWCGSTATERDGLFGPTPCRDVRFCRDCQQPFEAVRT